MMAPPPHAPLLLLLLAALTIVAGQAPRAVATNASAPNAAAAGAAAPAASPPPPPPRASIDQLLPHFSGIRSCLPFNVLVAAPQPTQPGDPAATTTNGRLSASGDFDVLNATAASLQDGVLTLSLTTGNSGFFSDQPIHLTVTVPPSGGNLSSVSNYGPGLVVLGPGIRTDELRVYAPTVGQVRALNLTADTLTFTGSGVLGSSLQGAFQRVTVTTGAATGSVAVTSITPVAVTANLGGITTLTVDAPAGTTIDGSAGGLSKVQFTSGECNIGSQASFGLPAFGAFGSAFGFSSSLFAKCERVSGPGPIAAASAAISPEWTCGVAVDGRLSCQGPWSGGVQAITLNINNGSVGPTAPELAEPATPAAAADNTTSAGSAQPNAGAQPSANATAGGVSANTAAGTAATAPSGSVSPAPAASSPAPVANTGGTFAVQAQPPTPAAATPAGTAPTPATGGARRLMQPPASPAPSQPVTTLAPSGALTTGAYTSGPGAFASGTSSASGPAGSTTQTTSSTGGAAPATTASFSNPVFIPDVPASAFAEGSGGAASPSPSPAATSPSPSPGAPAASPSASPSPSPPVAAFATSPAAASPSPSPSPSPEARSPSPAGAPPPSPAVPSAPAPSSVRISSASSGPSGGLALVNVACAAGDVPLTMLSLE